MVDKRKTAKILKQFTPKRAAVMGVGGEQFEIPNHSGDNSAGTILKTPVNDIDIPNKKYVDDEVAGGVGGIVANTILVLDGAVSTLNGNVLILQ